VPVLAALGVAEQAEERDHAVDERGGRHGHAEQVPPPVGAPPADEQHHGAEQREDDQQPRQF